MKGHKFLRDLYEAFSLIFEVIGIWDFEWAGVIQAAVVGPEQSPCRGSRGSPSQNKNDFQNLKANIKALKWHKAG